MITGIPILWTFVIFAYFWKKKKYAKTSFRLEIKQSNIFLHKNVGFVYFYWKTIATIPLLQQLPETLRNPRQMASQYIIICSEAKGLMKVKSLFLSLETPNNVQSVA